jgi:hypothetical protein
MANPSIVDSDASDTNLPTANIMGVALAMNLIGANPSPLVTGLDQLPGTSNYFIGNDPSQWHTNIPNYGQVAYQGVYPGVNLVYHGNEQQLEYDFVVTPGSDPSTIRLRFQGADSISLDDQGNLVLSTALGDVLEHAPVVYQEVGGVRQTVAGQFVLLGQDEVAFRVGTYDASLPLTVDPVLSYSTYLGGSGLDGATGIAVDGSGNAYVTGSTASTDFPTTVGAFQDSSHGVPNGSVNLSPNAFVTKLNATGTALIYSTYLGGSGQGGGGGDAAAAIAVDASGNAYVTGHSSSTDFPITAGAFQNSLNGSGNAFVTKLNVTGTGLTYSTYLGGSGGDGAQGIAVDGSGYAYVTGQTTSTDFPITAGAFQNSLNGSSNAFVTKLNASGTALMYSTYVGGSAYDHGGKIAVDSAGNAYVTGQTTSNNFPTTVDAFQTHFGGPTNYNDGFVMKVNATGTALIYSTYLGGNGQDATTGVAVDGSGNAYVTGATSSTNFPTTAGAFQRSLRGVPNGFGNLNPNAFVTKLNATGTALIYSTYLGGSGQSGGGGDGAAAIAVDASGNAYVTGHSSSTDFPITRDAYQISLRGTENAFVTKLNAAANSLLYSTYFGGGSDGASGIAVDGTGNAYVTGSTSSTNFLTTTGAFQASLSGALNAFVVKFILATPPATQFAITYLSATGVTAGGTATFTVTAEDSNGAKVPGYTGVIQITSTDGQALLGSASLPASYTFSAGDNGEHTFTATLGTAGSQTITVTDEANKSLTVTTSPITVTPGTFSKYLVGVPGGSTIAAGNPFLFTVQAADAFDNSVTSYSGPSTVTTAVSPPDPRANSPLTGTLNASGFGFFLETLKTAGIHWLTTTAGFLLSGASDNLTVAPGDATYFTVSAPTDAATGSTFNVTVTAYDHFGNIATGYTGPVKLSSTDPAINLGDYTFTTGTGKDNGVHTFSVMLNSAGSQTITATDTSSTNPTITGTSSPITTRGLTVTGLTPTPTGFSVDFSEPFTVADVDLYGGSQGSPLQDVTLMGQNSGPVTGSFVVDPSGMSATFKASSIFLSTFFRSSVLPDDTWTVTLVSGTGTGSSVHGFFDSLNAPLDGSNNAGHDNYTATFTTANSRKEALSIPDVARGPDGANSIKVPNDSAKGIPVTLSNVPAASGATDVVFTLTYNPTLLTPTGAGTGDSSGTGSTFSMGTPVSVDATHSTVTFTWHNAAAQSGTVVLGDILANVPNSAANEYKGKEILSLSAIKINGSDFTGVSANGLHVNAYFGDVTGDGRIGGLDVATAGAVAAGSSLGLSAFKLIDPAVVGDIAGDASIDATAVSDLASLTSSLPTPQIPAIPTGLTITPGGPDPTLSLGEVGRISNPSYSGIVSVPVMLDDPHPVGSTGMEEAVLALTYDPKVLTASASDITLGSIPGLGSGWHLVSVVDQATGQIGIDLYSTTAISATQAGSLVNIAFHVVPGVSVPATAVQLVNSVTVNGQYFGTEVADDQGQYVLGTGRDRLTVSQTTPLLFDRLFRSFGVRTHRRS